MPTTIYRGDNKSVARIRAREQPMVMSRSSDPSKRMDESALYRGNPLQHTSAIYDGGTNKEYAVDIPSWYSSLGARS
jgi:hypothetical protein